jgi:GT2 family glycosyltransferase
MPAYNAAQTLRKTHEEVMSQEIVDLVIVVDDGSSDQTVAIAKTLSNTIVYAHQRNIGYGGNQKSFTGWPWRMVAILSSWFTPATSIPLS